jgi:hypothetical protein
MKQLDSIAPDFTELLKCIQDIIKTNKSFYEVCKYKIILLHILTICLFQKLINMNPQNDLGDLLMHLVSCVIKMLFIACIITPFL